ncbi:PREDICTED: glycerophosphodiester [Prunus dulcis]|uniref:glycerophosphodiester phosphodiesterase n=1 Tax=Prunus dulcis TaxID=3755 RepID=A0A5E4FB32_PRUDU|nr:glycerophosphodiester phosphodiesterase GDPDL7-like [Prunus dulcis]VVA25135.1 PREDICTED: glycerophosphodiester [Prunus dulcis]
MIRCLLFISLLIHATLAAKAPNATAEAPNAGQKAPAGSPTKKWLTLNGQEPLVIARGGFSGLFPESSTYAIDMAKSQSLPGYAFFCNLQLTKDSVGICLSNILLDNTTTISMFYPKDQKTYNVNGKDIRGWFALDFTADQLLNNVSLTQNIFSRPSYFDGVLPIATVEDALGIKPDKFWLNVPYDTFYSQHKISMASFVEKVIRFPSMNYISSPEIGFLKTVSAKVNKGRTKLIFQFLDPEETEPTTKQKYSALVKNLEMIKSVAAGILVPKEYIWPVNKNNYLEAATTLVTEAHKQGLEVHASGFANDIVLPYNYSFDPTAEYLQFVDQPNFSVDGVLTDFPPTASETIACFAQNNNGTKPKKGLPLIITRNGASGTYPGCTDLAYKQAVDDGADIIDCSVQLSSDGVAFCLDTIDLNSGTNALSQFMTKSETIPELQAEAGVFSFQLSWHEIQSLKPQIQSPYGTKEKVYRNPANKDVGKLVTLSDFLEFSKTKAVAGILINIENAAYLASKAGLDIVKTVTSALSNATFDKQSTQQVLIKSDDTSVLSKFKDVKTYRRVLNIKEKISDATKASVDEIKKFADAVTVTKDSIVKISDYFISGKTNVVKEMKAANISVYVHWLKNEFVSLMFDYFSDPIIEIASYALDYQVDGIVTDFPATANKYMRCPCNDMDPKANIPYPILPVEPGSLLGLVVPEALSPAQAPSPALQASNVADPPLPEVVKKSDTSPPPSSSSSDSTDSGSKSTPAPGSPEKSSAFANAANLCLPLVAIVVLALLAN